MAWDRLSRREAMWVGALGGVGLSLPQLLRAEAAAPPARQKSVILIVPWGGPAQMDSLDLKPHAPAENRSPFQPIATKVPGIHICEHMPRLARLADQLAIIRSAAHRIGTHNPATHYVLTGHQPSVTDRELVPAQRSDWPSIGSILGKFQPSTTSLPSYVQLPLPLIDNGSFSGGQHGGFLGTAFDPMVISRDPNLSDFAVPGLASTPDLTEQRHTNRRDLLALIDRHAEVWRDRAEVQGMGIQYERAYSLLRSAATGQAFDIAREPGVLRDQYGRSRFGQSVLMARRLIEAGVRLVLVSDTTENTNGKWDTHGGNVYPEIQRSLRETDTALAALLTDLRDRGLLDTTIVIWMAEFGRSPRMSAGGGRDHWPQCYSLLMAGGGIRGGQVYGSSDSRAAYPRDNPCRPEDLHATIYTALGLPLETILTDPIGRPHRLCEGTPISALL